MKHLLLFVLIVTAASCSSTPTEPTTPSQTPVPNAPATADTSMAGQWLGLFELTACNGQGGDCIGPATNEFMLTLVPAAGGLEGVLVLLDRDRTTVSVTASGPSGAEQVTSAAGYDHAPGTSTRPVQTMVSSIELRLDSATGLTGTMTYANTTFRTVTRTVAFRSALRRPSATRSGAFDGTWQGSFRTVACTGECTIGGGGYNAPDGGRLDLVLSHAGSSAMGTVMGQPVSGTATSTRLTATGAGLTDDACAVCWDCEGVCQDRVTDVRLEVDQAGRLTGTIEYARKGWTGREHFRQTLRLELVSVTRRW